MQYILSKSTPDIISRPLVQQVRHVCRPASPVSLLVSLGTLAVPDFPQRGPSKGEAWGKAGLNFDTFTLSKAGARGPHPGACPIELCMSFACTVLLVSMKLDVDIIRFPLPKAGSEPRWACFGAAVWRMEWIGGFVVVLSMVLRMGVLYYRVLEHT